MIGCSSAWYSEALDWMQNPFIYCEPQEYYSKEVGLYLPLSHSDGVLDVAYDKEAYRDFLIYANGLVSEGLLSKLSFTMDSTQWDVLQKAIPSQVGVFVLGSADSISSLYIEDEYVAFTALIGPDGQQNQSIMPPTGYPYCGVTKYCDNPDAAMAVVNMLYDEVAGAIGGGIARVSRYGEMGVDWRTYNPELDTDIVSSIPGFDPGVIVLQQQWGTLSNKVVQKQIVSYVGDPGWFVGGVPEGTTNVSTMHGENWVLNIQHGPEYSDIVSDASFSYTNEEEEQWGDLRYALRQYVEEARTLFALGEMDPTSDAAWNAYLKELDNLHYQDILQASRDAYARKLEALGE